MTTTDHPHPLDASPIAPHPPSVPGASPHLRSAPAVPAGIRGPDAPDWTGLLPAGALGRVDVVGPLTGGARAALVAGEPVDPGGHPDTVIVTRDARRSIARAVALVGSEGTVWVERSTRRRRWSLVRHLRRSGFDVSVWWRRPSVERTLCLVCLDRRTAAGTVVRTVANRGRWAAGEVFLARSGLARLASAEVSVLARAPGGRRHEEPALAQPIPEEPIDGLVTPRFSSSRAVIGIATRDQGHHLSRVAKVARSPQDDAMVGDEAAHLDALLARTGPFPGAPTRPSLEVRSSRLVLVEDAVDGRPLDRRAVRRDPEEALRSGRRWVEGLPVGDRSRPIEDGRAAALISGPLAAIAAGTGHRALRRAELAGRARVLLAPLEVASLPVVFEHGDLCHPNVMRHEDGSLGVVDWEWARPDGLPLHDLTQFFAYVVESVERPSGPGALADVVGRALRTHGWAWPEVAAHTEHLGIDRRLVPLLVLASWTRRVAALGPARPSPHRDEVLWAAAVADLEERRR